ncbi:uncharacterized protein B0J16DRAFT_419236 [Fusarium flagelliforme]|uniref:uncharacterized protein n=1 Tax=Fusarium flagelliforme TaxID=2675880 RepID=UPI001E8D1BFF|nr:uncharacterized protein B0J16DRAFT_419236 [Fusarium flagelliforme]KAH7174014.1 hypothetical protein B0J16DRAFT_419236 [Fusarium flagelliforme]
MTPNSYGSNESASERRARNRAAQKKHRQKKQETDETRWHRITHLEGIIERMSTVVVDLTDRLLQHDIVQEHPGMMSTIQGAITDILNLANEAGDPMKGSKVRKARGRNIERSCISLKQGDVASAESLPDITITRTSHSPAVGSGQHDIVIDPALTQIPPMHEPLTALVKDAETPLPLAPTLYSQGDYTACTILQELEPILWSSSQPSLSPNSFISRLTYTCFNVGCLVLSKSIEAPIPLSEEYRTFGSTLRYRDRDEMIFRMKWLLGPGTNELQLLAELPWGGRWWDQEFSSTELCNYATSAAMIDSSAPRFLSAVGVEKQLMALGARLVDKETIELDSSGLAILSETRQEPTCAQPDSWSFVNFFRQKHHGRRYIHQECWSV